jgi:predicted ArsR family transcriptional regulator
MKGCGWLTGAEIAKKSGVVPRTVRAHLLKLVNLGLLDVAEVFPAHRYRISEKAEKRNASYIKRLDAAAEVFGLSVA